MTARALTVILACLATLARSIPSNWDTGLQCQPASSAYADWPSFHILNNVTGDATKGLVLEALNDVNGIFEYKGLYHAMNQAGGGNWTHAVSNDLVHWYHITDTLRPNPNSTWDEQGPCDGTVSFPDLGMDRPLPVIMYGPDCAGPKPSADVLTTRRSNLGDYPAVEVALPENADDPYLTNWVKTQPGPVTFNGTPCSFPGRVWKSKVGPYWNMLCAINGNGPWARYVSTTPTLMNWTLADKSFTHGVDGGQIAGALFHKIPNAAPGGPTHMIDGLRGGADFYVGTYDSQTETMNITMPVQNIVEGDYTWAAIGTNGPDPEADTGRVLTASWVTTGNSLSLIREISWDRKTNQLIASPISEYSLLRNATFLENATLAIDAKRSKDVPFFPPSAAGTSDVKVSFKPVVGTSGFGVSVRSGAVTVTAEKVEAAASGGYSVTLFFINQAMKVPGGKVNATGTVLIQEDETLDIQVFVDRSIVEWFVNRGRFSWVSVVHDQHFSTNNSIISVFNNGVSPVSAVNAHAYGMGCGWAKTKPEPRAAPFALFV